MCRDNGNLYQTQTERLAELADRIREMVKGEPVLQNPTIAALLIDGLRYRQDRLL